MTRMAVPRPRARRSQADRSERTRARILDAVIRCVEKRGFAGTTTRDIADEAGVSVGAVQHHFPSKASVLAAVLQRSGEDLAARFSDVSVEGASLDERVALFVDRAWRHYGSPGFRVTLEIILSARDPNSEQIEDWAALPFADSARRAGRLWRAIFADTGVPAARQRGILRYAFASLTGLALLVRLQPDTSGLRAQLGMLKSSLTQLLRDARDTLVEQRKS